MLSMEGYGGDRPYTSISNVTLIITLGNVWTTQIKIDISQGKICHYWGDMMV